LTKLSTTITYNNNTKYINNQERHENLNSHVYMKLHKTKANETRAVSNILSYSIQSKRQAE